MISVISLWILWVILGWNLSGHRVYLFVELVRAKEVIRSRRCIAWGVIQFGCFIAFAWMGQYVLRNCKSCPHPSSNPIAGGCWGDQTTEYQAFYTLHYICVAICIIRWVADCPLLPPIKEYITYLEMKGYNEISSTV